jgi:hypothetical protein
MLAHPTKHRGTDYDYDNVLESIKPMIESIIATIEALTGKKFNRLFLAP